MTSIANPQHQPRYAQISALIAREIASGRLIAGERLPPERAMAGQMGVATGTLRKALDQLETQGLINRIQGSGTYVAKPKRARRDPGSAYAFFRLEPAGAGAGVPSADVLSAETRTKPADLPTIGPGPTAHRIRRLRSLDGHPAAVEEIWLDARFASGISATDLPASLYAYYKTQLKLWITRAEDRVSVGEMPAWGPFPTAAPAGYVERISWSQDASPAEFSRTWYDPETVRYVARIA